MPEPVYTISELAREFGVTTRTIRFYEEKGLVSPRREGQRRLYSSADRVRIQLILRGKRIGMSLDESVEVIDLYKPRHDNTQQLHSLIDKVREKRRRFEQQKRDLEAILRRLDEVESLCRQALNDSDGSPDSD
jgi:DNA-binding transcriptional MerR regulator